jgi:hypothetical protein
LYGSRTLYVLAALGEPLTHSPEITMEVTKVEALMKLYQMTYAKA